MEPNPANQPNSAPGAEDGSNPSPETPADATPERPLRVLIIDDSRATRMVIRNFMREFGFTTEEAVDGNDALNFLSRDSNFDLFVVDWEMPGISGVEFVRQFRARPVTGNPIPILMATTVNAFERIAEALEAGASDYIMKPFTKEIFAAKLDLLGIDHK
jgi:two-component system, chemotaxis family, chemotaxis protein CheY